MKVSKAHDRFVMDAMTILTLVAEMKFIDAFVMDVFAKDKFWNHAVARNRLVIGAVILTLVEEIKLIDAFVVHGFFIG